MFVFWVKSFLGAEISSHMVNFELLLNCVNVVFVLCCECGNINKRNEKN